jgi:hypothetical protein
VFLEIVSLNLAERLAALVDIFRISHDSLANAVPHFLLAVFLGLWSEVQEVIQGSHLPCTAEL